MPDRRMGAAPLARNAVGCGNSNVQNPMPKECPSSKTQRTAVWVLSQTSVVDVWDLVISHDLDIGIWKLDLRQ